MDTLLAVPWYSDLLDDQDHEDKSKQGCLLVSSKQGWHTEMAKWIAEARAAELDKESDDDDIIPCSNTCIAKWKLVTLTNLFGGQDLLLLQPASTSVAMVVTNVFQINLFSVRNKNGKIAKIFVKTEDPENRGVI
jgi:hypothetical protein